MGHGSSGSGGWRERTDGVQTPATYGFSVQPIEDHLNVPGDSVGKATAGRRWSSPPVIWWAASGQLTMTITASPVAYYGCARGGTSSWGVSCCSVLRLARRRGAGDWLFPRSAELRAIARLDWVGRQGFRPVRRVLDPSRRNSEWLDLADITT